MTDRQTLVILMKLLLLKTHTFGISFPSNWHSPPLSVGLSFPLASVICYFQINCFDEWFLMSITKTISNYE